MHIHGCTGCACVYVLMWRGVVKCITSYRVAPLSDANAASKHAAAALTLGMASCSRPTTTGTAPPATRECCQGGCVTNTMPSCAQLHVGQHTAVNARQGSTHDSGQRTLTDGTAASAAAAPSRGPSASPSHGWAIALCEGHALMVIMISCSVNNGQQWPTATPQ